MFWLAAASSLLSLISNLLKMLKLSCGSQSFSIIYRTFFVHLWNDILCYKKYGDVKLICNEVNFIIRNQHLQILGEL